MSSEIKADKWSPASGTSATIGDSGDTYTIPSGVTFTNNGTATGFGATLTGSTDNTVVTVTGANAMQGEANLTFDGTDLDVGASAKISSNGTIANFGNHNGSATETALATSDGNEKVRCFNSGKITFEVAGSEKMEFIDGGKLGIGTSGNFTPTQRLNVYGSHVSESGLVRIQTSNGSGDTAIVKFLDGNSDTCGEITLNASGNSVAYGTSSDYRLKENEVAISDGITRLKTLKPYKFNFKSQPEKTIDGFFAHEVSNVVPESIIGEKDAMAVETRYTADDEETQGDTPSKNVGDPKTYSSTKIQSQGIDQSKLVPLLTSALQEAITKIETLEAKVAALESA